MVRRNRLIIFGACVLLLVAAAVVVAVRPSPTLQALSHTGSVTERVGGHPITIDTQRLASSDTGEAIVIITTESAVTEINSWYDTDNWMDIRPGYLSWREVDDDAGLDLILWLPNGRNELIATQYIASKDGERHTLPTPLKMPHDMSMHFFLNPSPKIP